MDLFMPVLNGEDAIVAIRSAERERANRGTFGKDASLPRLHIAVVHFIISSSIIIIWIY